MSNRKRRPRRARASRARPPHHVRDQGPPVDRYDHGGADETVRLASAASTMAAAIESGLLDAHLLSLATAVDGRIDELLRMAEAHAAAQLEVGDRVCLGSAVRPTYLEGATGTIAGWTEENVLVRLDHSVGRYPADTEIRVSPLGIRRDVG